jgi:Transposase DDE domain group 1
MKRKELKDESRARVPRQQRSGQSGLLPFDVELQEQGETLTARAGLTLVQETMQALELDRAVDEALQLKQRDSGYSEAELVSAIVLLQAAGGDCLDDIRVLAADQGLCRLLGRRALPSPDTLRHLLNAFHDEALIEAAKARRAPGQQAFIPDESAALAGLAAVNTHLVHRVAAQRPSVRATLDHDATIQQSHKRQALPHYKGGCGYQPASIYWQEQDVIVGDEYRDGNVPAGMQNLPLVQRAFAALPASVTERYYRADSACYDAALLKWLADDQRADGPQGPIGFSISADMSPELRAVCAAVPDAQWTLLDDRPSETVETADVCFAPGHWPKMSAPLRYVALRFRKKQPDLFDSDRALRYLAVVTNRWEPSAAELIAWHWQKAATIEIVHDVTKNELGAAVPPCERFGANAAWYRLCNLTYNVLSVLKSFALPPHFATTRPKRLRFAVFALAGRIGTHARRVVLRIAARLEAAAGFIAARARLAILLRPALATS